MPSPILRPIVPTSPAKRPSARSAAPSATRSAPATKEAASGPNLSDVGRRLKPHELLESIVDPSAQVPDAYATWLVQTADGHVHQGQIEHENAEALTLRAASAVDSPTVIPTADIEARRKSPTSNMPAGTINVLQREEVLDLLAYLLQQHGYRQATVGDLPPAKATAATQD